jgi:hypothetical protein
LSLIFEIQSNSIQQVSINCRLNSKSANYKASRKTQIQQKNGTNIKKRKKNIAAVRKKTI